MSVDYKELAKDCELDRKFTECNMIQKDLYTKCSVKKQF